MNVWRFGEFEIPEYMRGGINRYVNDHKAPGDFLRAVICNDLKEACGRADENNIANLPAYVAYFYNHAPSTCWGSEEAYKAWISE